LQRQPDRTLIRAENLMGRLSEPPAWLLDFAAHVAARFNPGRASGLVTALGRLLQDGQSVHPQALLERSRQVGRSMGTLARVLEDFFTTARLALPTDQAKRLAAGRRQRRIDAVPDTLRSAVAGFATQMIRDQTRALRAGTRPRTDQTIETALATVRDLALFLAGRRGRSDWALVDVHDIEAFLATNPKSRHRRLTVLRQFFRFAHRSRLLLIDPTAQLRIRQHQAFRGQTLTLQQQRSLFHRWTTAESPAHPHEALVGMLALLHAVSSQEVRLLRITDIDTDRCSVRLGNRPHAVPLDPATWSTLLRCLDHRAGQRTTNPHVIVTKQTKNGKAPASTAYLSHVLDGSGVPPRTLRSTRLVDLVNTLDPKLVAAALGLDPQAPLIYLADRLHPWPDDGSGAEPSASS
jgi:site-specific recombinase XerD